MAKNSKKRQQLYATALALFARKGWVHTSVDEICQAAQCSRVTFYAYYRNKHELLKTIIFDNKEHIRLALTALLAEESDMQTVIATLFSLQRQALDSVYSPAMRHDMEQCQDAELLEFFQELNHEKYQFMRHFFHTLQQRGLIAPQLPLILVDTFIRHMDVMMQDSALQEAYRASGRELPHDVLTLILHGLSRQEADH